MITRPVSRCPFLVLFAFLTNFTISAFSKEPAFIAESPRKIPVAHSVDVVVVGGSTHAVNAALAAKQHGAGVFLLASRPYLGEDLCGTLRLSLPAGVEPATDLGRRLFPLSAAETGDPQRSTRFTYTTDIQPSPRHPDTDTPSRLGDGAWSEATKDSVQYDGDMTLTVDLGAVAEMTSISLFGYEKPEQYGIGPLAVSVGDDPEKLESIEIEAEKRIRRETERWSVVEFRIPVTANARWLRLEIKRPEGLPRLLLGELVIETEAAAERIEAVARTSTPGHIKRQLDAVLLEAGIPFLYGCHVTDVLRDADGAPAGIVMANRAGRQAVAAKVIIDATPRATVARLAGATHAPWPAGTQTFRRFVIDENPGELSGLPARDLGPAPGGNPAARLLEYTLRLPMPDATFASFAKAEQEARSLTWRRTVLDAAETLFQVPPDPIETRAALPDGGVASDETSRDVFRPRKISRLYVLSASAGFSRETAEKLSRPLGLMEAGEAVGKWAAEEAGETSLDFAAVRLPSNTGAGETAPRPGDTGEALDGVRPAEGDRPVIQAEGRLLPVLGKYDVVVIGGGTSGGPAGIGAARQGAKTLVVEYLDELGGIGTAGLISRYHHGQRIGFTAEVDEGVDKMGGADHKGQGWIPRVKAEWWRRSLREAGADVWFGCLGCGAVVENHRVTGAVVSTPEGRGAILAEVVIDATGNSDIAAVAGAETVFIDASDIAVQGAGLPRRDLGAGYTNSDYLLVDDSDMVDRWRAFLAARREGTYDTGKLIDTRERRRIVGDYVLSILDQASGRTFPDTVVFSESNYDSHGYPVHPYFALLDTPPGQRPPGGTPYTPYRCLLPKGIDGLLVIGLGASAHRDAMALIRMQADLQNQGYAAGVAAGMAVENGVPPREIDGKALQQRLVEVGNLPEEVLKHEDSFPASTESLREAAGTLGRIPPDPKSIALLLAHQDRALPLIREAFASAVSTDERLACARFLGVCGDAAGLGALVDALDSGDDWDDAVLLGSMAEYSRVPSRTDSLIFAAGRTHDAQALEPILKWARRLDAEVDFSHHRAVALALEELADPAAAPVLAELLRKEGMGGHVLTEPGKVRDRREPLREIVLARALYRCGDHDGLGEQVLRGYTGDLSGILARHAAAVLEEIGRR